METIFTNTENSKTNEPYRFRLDLADKLSLNLIIKKHENLTDNPSTKVYSNKIKNSYF